MPSYAISNHKEASACPSLINRRICALRILARAKMIFHYYTCKHKGNLKKSYFTMKLFSYYCKANANVQFYHCKYTIFTSVLSVPLKSSKFAICLSYPVTYSLSASGVLMYLRI